MTKAVGAKYVTYRNWEDSSGAHRELTTDYGDFGEMGYIYAHREHNEPVTWTRSGQDNIRGIGDNNGYITLVANPGWTIYGLPKMKAYSRGSYGYDTYMGEVPRRQTSEQDAPDMNDVGHYTYITWHSDDFHEASLAADTFYIEGIYFSERLPEELVEPPAHLASEELVAVPKPSPLYEDDPTLPEGTLLLKEEGRQGEEKIVYFIMSFVGGNEQWRIKLSEYVTVHARPDVYARGTGSATTEPTDPDDTRETIAVEAPKPTQDGKSINIPVDNHVLYKNYLTNVILEGTVEFTGNIIVIAELRPDLSLDYIYKLIGTNQWEFGIEGWEGEDTKLISHMVAGFRSRNPLTGLISSEYTTTRIDSASYPELVDIKINGTTITNWTPMLSDPQWGGGPYREDAAYINVSPGYKEIRLSLKNSDFRWTSTRDNYIHFSNGEYYSFTTDYNGDMVWAGEWPINETTASMGIYPVAEHLLYRLTISAPKPTYVAANIIDIPDHPMIEYIDADTADVLPPGDFQQIRYTRIRARLKKAFIKEGSTYYNYELANSNYTWHFTTDGQDDITLMAPAPTQKGNILTIPDITGVFYWDNIATEVVEGQIDLRTRQYERCNIQPFAEYENFTLSNKNAVWVFTTNTRVESQQPTQDNNTITIPAAPGIIYIDNNTGNILSGTIEIEDTIVIEAKPMLGYTLTSTENEWTFTLTEDVQKPVEAEPIEITGNWVTIPFVLGVRYFNVQTNETLQDVIYIQESTTIGAETTSNKYRLTNQGIKWTVEPQQLTQKEIVLVNRHPNLTYVVNGKIIHSNAFLVDIGVTTTITLKLNDESNFEAAPYLKDNLGGTVNFTLTDTNTRATLDIIFDDTTPSELHAPNIKHTSYTVKFVGANATLEVKRLDGISYTIQPGEIGTLNLNDSYTLTLNAHTGYEFDRNGRITYNGQTTDIPLTNTTTAQTNVDFVTGNVTVYIEGMLITTPDDPTDVTGFNSLYLVDKTTLSEISHEMFTRKRQFMISPDGTDEQLVTNPHTYIINTIQFPFKIKDEQIISRQRITLGFTTLQPSAPRLNTDKLTVDLGTITVTGEYNNSYDYKNTDVLIHLPYINPISIDPNYAINQTIGIEYIVDAYTGETTINLRSSLTEDNVFYSVNTRIGNEIPFISTKDADTIGSPQESRTTQHNNTPIPFIEVLRSKPYQMDSVFNRDVRTTVQNLEGITGHVYFHDIELDMTATLDEVTRLKSILSQGIVIK